MTINHKHVLRIMREDNLLAIRYRKYVLTSDSRHECEVYLNLAARMTLSGVNQLWVADITYIRLRVEFVFLAVVIDRFSRKAVGWALGRTLTARVAVAGLRQAGAGRKRAPGVVHHSDQGVQYACADYVAELKANGMVPSMSRPANPYDNAFCESFMKTLKQEEIYCNQYGDFQELSEHIGNSWEITTTANGCTRPWDIGRRRTLSGTWRLCQVRLPARRPSSASPSQRSRGKRWRRRPACTQGAWSESGNLIGDGVAREKAALRARRGLGRRCGAGNRRGRNGGGESRGCPVGG